MAGTHTTHWSEQIQLPPRAAGTRRALEQGQGGVKDADPALLHRLAGLVQLGLYLDLIPVNQSAGRATPVVTGFLGRRAGVFLF